jgi:anti-sigma-K factor RskA
MSDSTMSDSKKTCQELSDSYELYALGVLSGDDERATQTGIDAHLARGCENCRRGVADATALNVGIMTFVDTEIPRARLKRRVMASIGVEKPGWGWVWAVASACLLLLALWLGVQERNRATELADARRSLLDVQGQRDHLTQAMQFLSDPQTQPASFGRGQSAPPRGYVFLHPQMGVLLIASNLPAAGTGKAYEMWVIPKGGAPRPAGLFQSDGKSGLHILNGPVDIAVLGAVAVTLEPEAGSPAPTSMPIIVAPLG